jgi:presequence protease
MTVSDHFEIVFERNIPELQTLARFYRHKGTGAEILSLVNDDENKVFGISFRTPPSDSTGVAHILEHSVLCGSRKYPVKEPFVELLKGSLKTFLNAFTYPDKTCYPVASLNAKDFYNLIDVYLDAVFYPRLTPYVLQQEGWHYELEAADSPIRYKGVVFNEMKGVYSSPDSVLAEASQQSLFPDITYGLDSGGDPKVIPSLTYEQFVAFHSRLYHPSNARIFFYGDDDPDRRLEIIQEYLKDFDRITVDSEVPLQPGITRPSRIVRPFDGGKDGPGGERPKGMVTVNWLLDETADPELNLSFQVLEYILLGMPGSPLRKALIESGLGEDLAGGGLEIELRQAFFSTGLKGANPAHAYRIELLAAETLYGQVRDGIDPATVEAALNTIEFRLRENNYGRFPRGLVLMLLALSTWLYGGDPAALLAFEAPLSSIKSRVAAGERVFEDLIDRYVIRNSHRSTVIMEPDSELAGREEALELERLSRVKAQLSAQELEELAENTRELRRKQSAPDSPEALATIPVLRIADLERENKLIPISETRLNGATLLRHDIFTGGITYLDLGLNLRLLPQDVLPYAPLFGRALVEMGTQKEDYAALSKRISGRTGGIRPEIFTSAVKGESEPAVWLFMRGKSMAPQTGELAAILGEALATVKLDNRERFRQIVLEEKARCEKRIVPSGHQMVDLRLRAHFHPADWAREQMNGISYLVFLRKLVLDMDGDWDKVLDALRRVRRALVNRSGLIVNLTAEEREWSGAERHLSGLLNTLPDGQAAPHVWSPELFPEFEGITIPAQVNYVGKGASLSRLGYGTGGSVRAVMGYLRTSWLWEKVRVQGGAYGAMCLLDRISGTITFASYRDPNLIRTVENFDGCGEFLRSAALGEDEIRKAIIGAIGDLDAHLLPDARGYTSMLRYLNRDDDEGRQRMRDEILSTTEKDFRAFADALDAVKREGVVKVLGSETAIEAALAERPGWLDAVKLM